MLGKIVIKTLIIIAIALFSVPVAGATFAMVTQGLFGLIMGSIFAISMSAVAILFISL